MGAAQGVSKSQAPFGPSRNARRARRADRALRGESAFPDAAGERRVRRAYRNVQEGGLLMQPMYSDRSSMRREPPSTTSVRRKKSRAMGHVGLCVSGLEEERGAPIFGPIT